MPEDNKPKFDNLSVPLYEVLGKVAALWTLANFGYFLILPALGLKISYNASPIPIALYFLFWAAASVWLFWDIFSKWVAMNSRIWLWGGLSLAFAAVLGSLLRFFALLPELQGLVFAPYTDILLATPWYFLPKSAEILAQQTLIMALVLSLYYRFHSLKDVMIGYAVTFGGAHVLLFLASGAPTPYAAIMTASAIASTFVFPYFMLKVRGGFMLSYATHLLFYIALALIFRAWPLPGYGI